MSCGVHAGTPIEGAASNEPADAAVIHTREADIPFSSFASNEAREALAKLLSTPQAPGAGDVESIRSFHRRFADEQLAEMRTRYSVTIRAETIGGVRTDVVEPAQGVDKGKRDRVLISLHGGGFMWGAGSGALVEAVPIASVGGIRVVAIDYRMAPEHRFPAASEDVAAVYRALLKHYAPENIGLYGCSAGGILAAQAVAWFQAHDLPAPGAIATLCATGAELEGDSAFLAPLLSGQPPIPRSAKPLLLADLPYFAGVDRNDPLAYPIVSTEVLARFPATLLLTGSRDFAASSLTIMHRKLRSAGVPAELFLFDGLWHAFIMMPGLPESREAYDVVVNFFDAQLGRRAARQVVKPVCTIAHVSSLVSAPIQIETAAYVPKAADVPAHCAVSGFVEHGTRIGFAVALPDAWNRKFLFLGVGGFAGVLEPLHRGIVKGYATGTTDTGHRGASLEDATWALNNPAGVVNHYETGVERAAQALKGLTTAYYGALPQYAYFEGCSAGGRQGLIEAQRYPGTFDGIVAAAPAWNYTRLLASFVENGRQILSSSENWIPPEAFAEIDRVVTQQCDATDGVVDTLIGDPRQCTPDLRELLCVRGSKSRTCLTAAQLRTVGKLRTPEYAKRDSGYFGFPLTGSERTAGYSWGWAEWFFGTVPPVPDGSGRLNFAANVLPKGAERGYGPNQFVLGEQFFRYIVANDATFDAREFRMKKDVGDLERSMGELLNADDTDLSRFVGAGGKLLIWHGWSDPAIPAEMAIDLHARIRRDTASLHGQGSLDDSVRLFMVPGVQHCGGGFGLTHFDALSALERWVEHGAAPDRIEAMQIIDGTSVRSRPLCSYPKTARFRGGSPDQAASFDCQ